MESSYSPDEVATFERETWSRCAPRYMATFALLTNAALPALLDAAAVDDGSRVLDVGTGPGNAAAAVRDRGGAVIGIDFSKAMIAEARQCYPEIEFKEADAGELPFPDRTFDAVISNLSVHHMARPERYLREARRVLRDGGKVAFTVWADPAKLEAFGLFFAAIEKNAGAAALPHGPLFGVSDFDVFRGMVSDAGLRQPQVSQLDIAWHMPTLDALLDGFADWANISLLPETTRDAIEADVRQAGQAYQNGGGYVIPNPVILVSATR